MRSNSRSRTSRAIAALALGAAGCTAAPAPAEPGTATVWGQVRLVPPPGVSVDAPAAYGDRRVADAVRVDYSRPGFVVVFVEGPPGAPGTAALVLSAGRLAPRFEPAEAAVGLGGVVSIRNDDTRPHTLSIPAAALLQVVAPGETLDLLAQTAGEWSVHALDAGETSACVFVAPGPHAVVAPSGRYELRRLEPGRLALWAWHPRFPAIRRTLDVGAGTTRRVDLELGPAVPVDGEAAGG